MLEHIDTLESFMENSTHPYHSPLASLPDFDAHSERSTLHTIDSETLRAPQHKQFTFKAQLHYQYVVKYLPILIILIPSLLTLFFPEIIKIGDLQIGTSDYKPSAIVVDLCSILTLCWIVKFLLDWPWKWYLQIIDLKLKLSCYLESMMDDEQVKTAAGDDMKELRWQERMSLICCVVTPFLCWGVLLFAREKILVGLHRDNQILSDLNIAIFVSCGLLRVVIQVSEHIQKSTASIEQRAERLIQSNMRSLAHTPQDMHLQPAAQFFGNDMDLLDRMARMEVQIVDMSSKVDQIYSKNKLAIDNNLSFVSSKHFKIIEKEINELNYKLNTRSLELEEALVKAHNVGDYTNPHAQLQDEASSVPPLRSPETQTAMSTHGVFLSKHPAYFSDNEGRGPMYPIEEYSRSLARGFPSLLRLNEYFPVLEKLQPNGGQHDFDESALNDLTEMNNNKIIEQVIWMVIYTPIFINRIIWTVVSFVPTRVLRGVYAVALMALDALVYLATKSEQPLNMQFVEGEIQQQKMIEE